jgi:hypothetical protein
MEPLDSATDALTGIEAGPAIFNFGLSHRTRIEGYDNQFLPNNRQVSRPVYLFRNRFWMEMLVNPHFGLNAMFQDARKKDDFAERGRFWEDPYDLQELYADIKKIGGADLTLRIGRQPLSYGNQRLVGAFEWSNPGRRFDAIRAFWVSDDKVWKVDGFVSKVVRVDPEEFNSSHQTEEFHGVHLGHGGFKPANFEVYAFYRDDNNLSILTVGSRIFAKDLLGALDYDIEGAYQTGETGVLDQRAGALHAEVGWTFSPAWKPRLMAEFNYGSGDANPLDGENNTFNNLFPTNHLHYGYIDYINWSNTLNGAVGFEAKPRGGVKVWSKAWYFHLAEERDAWRNAAAGVLGRDTRGRSGGDVGWEVDIGAKLELNKHLSLEVGYSVFMGGDFVDAVRPRQHSTSQFAWFEFNLKL